MSDVLFDVSKISIKYFAEKRTSRTYIYGLEKFIQDKKEVDTFCKGLKKKLATSCTEKEVDGHMVYGFQGDHQDKIKEHLVKSGIVKATDIC